MDVNGFILGCDFGAVSWQGVVGIVAEERLVAIYDFLEELMVVTTSFRK